MTCLSTGSTTRCSCPSASPTSRKISTMGSCSGNSSASSASNSTSMSSSISTSAFTQGRQELQDQELHPPLRHLQDTQGWLRLQHRHEHHREEDRHRQEGPLRTQDGTTPFTQQLEKTNSNAFSKFTKSSKPLSPLKKIPISKDAFDKISKEHFNKQLN